MSDYSTPPPPPAPDRRARPTAVTAAAILLIIGGALGVLGGILIASGAGAVGGAGALFVIVGLITLALGVLQIYAGVQVLNLREIGRTIGIVVAAVGALFALLSIGRTPATSVVSLLIDAFIIYALVANADAFSRT